jgi:SsrA-binding protein
MAPKGSQRVVKKIVAENRKARYNYEIMDTYEAGLMLMGTEVKALREGKANIAESYASDEGGEIWLINSYLPEYLQANRFNHEPRRRRKLLLSAREIGRLRVGINREGMTLIPLKIYFNDQGRAKLELALAKGKKLHDKRQSERSAIGTGRRAGFSRITASRTAEDIDRRSQFCCAAGVGKDPAHLQHLQGTAAVSQQCHPFALERRGGVGAAWRFRVRRRF